MQHTETKTITETKTVVTKTTCDLCGNEIKAMVAVEMEMRSGCADSGSVESFDVCRLCWRDKVVPWMASQGAKPREFDW